MDLLSLCAKMPRQYLKLGHDRLIPNLSQLILDLSPFHEAVKVTEKRR
jgi:hypothetical protein